MRNFFIAVALLFTLSCAAFWRDARTALTVTEAACVLAHAEQFDSMQEVATACGIVDALAPALIDLLKAEHIARSHRGACSMNDVQKYQTGYRFNADRRAISHFASYRRLMAGDVPAHASLTAFAPRIFDQGQTGSCVGHSRARGIFTARAAAGHPLTFVPSPVDLYRLARCYERDNWADPIADEGSDPVDTIDAAATFGVRPMGPMAQDGRYSDAEPATVNDMPGFGDLEIDREFRLLDDYQIKDFGTSRIQLVKRAIAAKLPVCLDVAGGSKQFQNYGGGVLHGDNSQLDHYVILLGYQTNADGTTTFEGHNSWGLDWGMIGAFLADESLVQKSSDLIVCVEHGL